MEFRHGSIGLVIDDMSFNWFETMVETFTNDCYHSYCIHKRGVITEALIKEGVVKGHISKYYDKKSVSLILVPRKECFYDDVLDDICVKWMKDVGKQYDCGNILGNPIFNSKEKRICSEHTAQGYKLYHKFLEKEPQDVSPNCILRDVLYTNFKYFMPHIIVRAK